MFSNVALLITASLAVFVAATPVPGGHAGSCNTGPVQCCNKTHKSDSAPGATILALVGINAQSFTGDIGAQCSPITALGLGSGARCGSSPVCCENNSFNGLIAIGCSPINLNL